MFKYLIHKLKIRLLNLYNTTVSLPAASMLVTTIINPEPLIKYSNKWWLPKQEAIIVDCQNLTDVIPMYGVGVTRTHVVKTILYIRMGSTRAAEIMLKDGDNKESFMHGYMGLVIAENTATGADDILTYTDVRKKITFANVAFKFSKNPKQHTD